MVAAEGDSIARDRAIQEDIVRALASEREYWRRKCEGIQAAIKGDGLRFLAQSAMLRSYIAFLVCELRMHTIPIPPEPVFSSFDPLGWMLD